MKYLIIIILLSYHGAILPQEINVISYNIRFDNPADGINAWPNRKEMVIGLLRFHSVEIIGLQEALKNQINDICSNLTQMKYIGVGRDDGYEAGEYSPIMFDTSKFKLIRFGWFWLSEHPEKPSRGWDARFNRICTWVELQTLKGINFMVFNTHLDHEGKKARVESVKLIQRKIEELNPDHLPLILMGDFNSVPSDEPVQLVSQFLTHARNLSLEPPYGPVGTFNGFNFNSPLTDCIDYIFVNDKVQVLKYGVLSDSENNRYPSDHLPVFARIALK